ncbi:MAG: DUF1365 domain-containing protein [Proteobacteria bacterium]|nr:DUF1365 domain-containing protein [Pseudomonadota bacterium]
MTATRPDRRSALYPGTLVHARHDAVAHRVFRYPLYVAAFDLDELADPTSPLRRLRLLAYNRRNLFALDDRDFADATRGLRAAFDAHDLPHATTVRLITNPRVLGYTFNPVSFFLGYDARGAIITLVAEVNNTYGGRHRYVLGPAERLPDRDDGAVGFRAERVFFVSPFLHGPMTYDFWFRAPLGDGELVIEMFVTDRETGSRTFTATFTAPCRALTDRALLAAAVRFPLMTAQVIALIHVEAMILRLRGAPYRRPGPDHRPAPRVNTR